MKYVLGMSQAAAYRLVKLFREGGPSARAGRLQPRTPEGSPHARPEAGGNYPRDDYALLFEADSTVIFEAGSRSTDHCLAAGFEAPNWRTIKDGLESIDLRRRAKRRGETKIIKATSATPGELRAALPLEIVQIDHTKADIFVVDEETRAPIGCP